MPEAQKDELWYVSKQVGKVEIDTRRSDDGGTEYAHEIGLIPYSEHETEEARLDRSKRFPEERWLVLSQTDLDDEGHWEPLDQEPFL